MYSCHSGREVLEPKYWYINFGVKNALLRLFRHPNFQAERGHWRASDWGCFSDDYESSSMEGDSPELDSGVEAGTSGVSDSDTREVSSQDSPHGMNSTGETAGLLPGTGESGSIGGNSDSTSCSGSSATSSTGDPSCFFNGKTLSAGILLGNVKPNKSCVAFNTVTI